MRGAHRVSDRAPSGDHPAGAGILVLDGGRIVALGTALFRHGAGLASPESLPVSLDMVLMFTWVHGLVFAMVILFLFVVCEFGFLAAAMMFAEPVLHALAGPAILIANLLAADAMGGYFRLRHPNLRIRP